MTADRRRPDPVDPGSRARSPWPRGGILPALALLASLLPAAAAPLPAQEGERAVREASEARRGLLRVGTSADTTPEGIPAVQRPWQAWVRDAAALASLFTLDRPLRTAARQVARDATEASAVDRIADRMEWFGDWKGSLPWVVGGSLAVGQLTEGGKGLREGAALLAGTAAAAMANEALNRAVGRGRPSWEEGVLHLEPFRGHASFPSGHTAYVFGVASGVDAVTEGWAPAAAAYGVAGLTGLSRIYHDRHWLTDVVAGAALATVVSRLATREALGVLGVRGEREPGRSRPPGGLRVEPLVGSRTLGVTLRF